MIGLNIHGNSINDRAKLLRFLEDTKPRAVLVMDNYDLAKQVKALLAETAVIYRTWPDEDLHKRFTAQAWVDQKALEIGGADLWAYATNEPGFSDDVLNWSTAVIEAAAARGLKVVIGNWSAGTPNFEDWKRPAARKLLAALEQHRASAILGLHEYSCGVVTSGYIGGEPGFIQPSTWPKNVTDVVMWHAGRFHQLIEACDIMAIKPPRIIVTEHGFDNLSDVAFWRDRLLRTPPYTDIRGWKTLANQWRAWWPHWNSEQAYAAQLIYADKTIYANTPVEAQLIFSWGASSEVWQQFNIEDASELQTLLVDYAKGATVTIPARRYAPNVDMRYAGANTFNIRAEADTSGVIKGQFKAGDTVRFADVGAVSADGHLWQRGTITPAVAPNLAIDGWLAVDIIALTPAPVKSAAVEFDEIYNRYRAALALATATYEAEVKSWKEKNFPPALLKAA